MLLLVVSVLWQRQVTGQPPSVVAKERVINDTVRPMTIEKHLVADENLQQKETSISRIERTLFVSYSKTDGAGNIINTNEVQVWLRGQFGVFVSYRADLSGTSAKVMENGDVYLYYPMAMYEYMNQKFQQFIDKGKRMVDLNSKRSLEIHVRVDYTSRSVNGEISFSE